MSSIVAYIFVSSLINIIQSETITCNKQSGCHWHCPRNGRCDNNIYNCPSTAIACHLKCNSCNGVQIFSSADTFNIACTAGNGCPNMQITTETADSSIQLQCSSIERCSGVILNCSSGINGICQCLDNGLNICDDQVLTILPPSISSTNSPSIAPITSIADNINIQIEATDNVVEMTKVNMTTIINIYSEQEAEDKKDPMRNILMIIISVCLLVFICTAVFLIIWHCTKRERKQMIMEVQEEFGDDIEPQMKKRSDTESTFPSSQLYLPGKKDGKFRLTIPVFHDRFINKCKGYNEGNDNEILNEEDDEEKSVEGHNTTNGLNADDGDIDEEINS